MNTMCIQRTCIKCSGKQDVIVATHRYEMWKKGALAQDAFPELSDDEREILISHICGTCFDAAFPPEGEDD